MAASPVAQTTLAPAMIRPSRVAFTVGGGTSGISIFRDLKKRPITERREQVPYHGNRTSAAERERLFLAVSGENADSRRSCCDDVVCFRAPVRQPDTFGLATGTGERDSMYCELAIAMMK
jgi:hypothetical protein